MISWKWIALSLAVLLTVLQASLWIGQGSIAEVVALERQLGSMSATNEELRARNERLEVEVAEFRFYVVVKH